MERWIESGSEIARLSTEGVATYWSGALARGAAPWDVFDDVRRWWTESTRQERPRWHSPNEIVLECPVARLRDFSEGSNATWCRRWCCRRRPAMTPASSTSPPRRAR